MSYTLEERVAAQQESIVALRDQVIRLTESVDALRMEVRVSREDQIRSSAEKDATRRVANVLYIAVSFVVSTVMPVLIYFLTNRR